MTAAIRHRDWDVSTEHARLIVANWPRVSVRRPELRKRIPGLTGRRLSDEIRSGIWMKPLGSESGKTFSSVRDVARKTAVLFVIGSTTNQSAEATEYEIVRDLIRELFHDRRATCLNGEIYSRVLTGDYDIDDALSRKYDVDLLEIVTWFREDRTYTD